MNKLDQNLRILSEEVVKWDAVWLLYLTSTIPWLLSDCGVTQWSSGEKARCAEYGGVWREPGLPPHMAFPIPLIARMLVFTNISPSGMTETMAFAKMVASTNILKVSECCCLLAFQQIWGQFSSAWQGKDDALWCTGGLEHKFNVSSTCNLPCRTSPLTYWGHMIIGHLATSHKCKQIAKCLKCGTHVMGGGILVWYYIMPKILYGL